MYSKVVVVIALSMVSVATAQFEPCFQDACVCEDHAAVCGNPVPSFPPAGSADTRTPIRYVDLGKNCYVTLTSHLLDLKELEQLYFDPVCKLNGNCITLQGISPVQFSEYAVVNNQICPQPASATTTLVTSTLPPTTVTTTTAPADMVILVVGGDNDNGTLSATETFDASVDKWEPFFPLKTPRTGLGVGVTPDKLYVVGGSDEYGNTGAVFDFRTYSWHSTSDLTTFRSYFGNLAVLPSSVFTCGPVHSEIASYSLLLFGGSSSSDTSECYNSLEDKWFPGPAMTTSRAFHASVTLDNRVYLLGGADTVTNMVEYYEPIQGKWHSVRELPFELYCLAATTYNGMIFIAGGSRFSGTTRSAAWYNPSTNNWKSLPDLNTERYGLGLAVLDNHLFAMGGAWGKDAASVESLDISDLGVYENWNETRATDAGRQVGWSTSLQMITPREWFGYCLIPRNVLY